MEATTTKHTPVDISGRTTSDLTYYLNIVWTLAVSEFKLKYFGSVLGYIWTLARPLMLFGVLYIVFTKIVRFGSGIPNYPLVLLTSIVMWTFFADATSGAISSLVSRESLVRKMSFPLSSIPIATALTASFNFCLNLVAVFVFYTISGISPMVSWFEFPLIVLGLVAFSVPVSVLLSILYVRYRDIQHIWDVVLQMGFWGSPIIYTIEKVPESMQRFIMFNPIAVILEQTRHVLIDPNAPTAADAIGGAVWLLVPLSIFLTLTALSIIVFRRDSKNVAELL